ncbi:MAG: cohesin domain-containing protein [Patescibacteria group bacterium]|jgi:hypothetical protein
MAKALKIFALNFIGLIFFVFGAWPNISHAADLFFSPVTGSGTVGASFSVVAKLNTNGIIANAVDASITFPAGKLQVSSISTSGSAVSLWVMNPRFDNNAGTITFTGGQPRPGLNGSNITLAIITFVPITTGSATISYSGVSVLSGDGLASELLSGLGSATFTLNPAPPPPPAQPTPSPTTTPAPVIIYVPEPKSAAPIPEQLVCPETVPTICPTETLPTEAVPSTEQISETVICPSPATVSATISAPPLKKPIINVIVPATAILFSLLWRGETIARWGAKAIKNSLF